MGLLERARHFVQPRLAARQPADLELLELAREPAVPHGDPVVHEREPAREMPGTRRDPGDAVDLQLEARLEARGIRQRPEPPRGAGVGPEDAGKVHGAGIGLEQLGGAGHGQPGFGDAKRDGAAVVGTVADAAGDAPRGKRVVAGIDVDVAVQPANRVSHHQPQRQRLRDERGEQLGRRHVAAEFGRRRHV